MNLPKRTVLKELNINDNSSYQLASMTYKGTITYSVGKMLNGSFYPKTYTTETEALNDYNKLIGA